MFIGLVKFEIKQWFSGYQDQFCAWFSLARLPTGELEYFSGSFSKKETALFFLPASCTCSMPRQEFFEPYLLRSHVK